MSYACCSDAILYRFLVLKTEKKAGPLGHQPSVYTYQTVGNILQNM